MGLGFLVHPLFPCPGERVDRVISRLTEAVLVLHRSPPVLLQIMSWNGRDEHCLPVEPADDCGICL